MLARYAAAAAGLGCAGASPNKSFPREVGGRFGIRNLSRPPKLSLRNQPRNLLQESVPGCRESGRSFRSGKPLHWFPSAAPEEYATAAALPVASFGHGRAVVALGDTRVKHAQIFRDGSDDFFAFGGGRVELFLFLGALRLNFFSLGSDSLLRFFQSRLRYFHAAFDFFRGHHHFELAVVGFGNFGLGVGNFMLQSFKGFVGFYRATLIAIFARAVKV